MTAPMTTPMCPNCRERLSDVEHGFGGIWSCLYCDGTWLSARQFEAAMAATAAACAADAAAHTDLAPAAQPECPACAPLRLVPVAQGPVLALRCGACHGAFLSKGLLATHAPRLAARSGEAPVAKGLLAMMGSLALLDPWPLLVALWRPRRKKPAR